MRYLKSFNGFEKTKECVGFFFFNNLIATNVWCYEQVCLAEMFNFSTNIIGKLAYSTCYMKCRLINDKSQLKR